MVLTGSIAVAPQIDQLHSPDDACVHLRLINGSYAHTGLLSLAVSIRSSIFARITSVTNTQTH